MLFEKQLNGTRRTGLRITLRIPTAQWLAIRDTVRQFGLGFAPGMGEWLVVKAANKGLSTEILETVGLIAKRNEGRCRPD